MKLRKSERGITTIKVHRANGERNWIALQLGVKIVPNSEAEQPNFPALKYQFTGHASIYRGINILEKVEVVNC